MREVLDYLSDAFGQLSLEKERMNLMNLRGIARGYERNNGLICLIGFVHY